MRRKGTDEIEIVGDETPSDVITIQSQGSGTADALHLEHPEFLDKTQRVPFLHRLLDLVRRPLRD
jgi:hypothetical protein